VTRRAVWLLAAAVLVAGVCVRLGFWQLERLAERRAFNARVLAAAQLQPVELAGHGPVDLSFRPVIARGRYDHEHEFVLANRPRRGSPGVHVLTPLLQDGADSAVLVVRGWVYSADATHAPLERWREDSARDALGYIRPYEPPDPRQPPALSEVILRRLEYEPIAAQLPYPLSRRLVVLTYDYGDTAGHRPVRLEQPNLGEGNHLSYAFQWFAFAAIAIAGTLVFIRHSRRPAGTRSEPEFHP
jgi:surfeit locus 1 family protein